jgi:two-component system, chemotaxis family, chemotaxis protein CheY
LANVLAMDKNYNIERVNFLIVEDNQSMSVMVKALLAAFGARNIVQATDGADAFQKLKHFPADIIICDWVMQPLDGMDFVRLIRTGKDSPNPFVPVIMLTGYTEMHRVLEARDVGANEFLAKPISAKKLFSRIKAIIDSNRPFYRTKGFFGPDRRRKDVTTFGGLDKRNAKGEAIPTTGVMGAGF